MSLQSQTSAASASLSLAVGIIMLPLIATGVINSITRTATSGPGRQESLTPSACQCAAAIGARALSAREGRIKRGYVVGSASESGESLVQRVWSAGDDSMAATAAAEDDKVDIFFKGPEQQRGHDFLFCFPSEHTVCGRVPPPSR